MAKIRYTGGADIRIPGIGSIDKDWTPVPDHIAAEHDSPAEKAAGWEVERDAPASAPAADGGEA